MVTAPEHVARPAWMLPLVSAHPHTLPSQVERWIEAVLTNPDLNQVCRTASAQDSTGRPCRAAVVGQDRAEMVQALRSLQDRTPHPGVFGPHHGRASTATALVLIHDLRGHPPPRSADVDRWLCEAGVDHVVLLHGSHTRLDHQWTAQLPKAPWTRVATAQDAAHSIARGHGGVPLLVLETGSTHLAPELVDLLPSARVSSTGTTPLGAARAAAEVHLWRTDARPGAHKPTPAPPAVAQAALLSALANLAHLPEGISPAQRWCDLPLEGADLARLVQRLRMMHGWPHLTCEDVMAAGSFSALARYQGRVLVPAQARPSQAHAAPLEHFPTRERTDARRPCP
ncbi:hypothetical protein [Nocardiopsis nanhaiensis]